MYSVCLHKNSPGFHGHINLCAAVRQSFQRLFMGMPIPVFLSGRDERSLRRNCLKKCTARGISGAVMGDLQQFPDYLLLLAAFFLRCAGSFSPALFQLSAGFQKAAERLLSGRFQISGKQCVKSPVTQMKDQ